MDQISLGLLLGIATITTIFLFLNPKAATYLLIFLCIFDLGFFSRWFEVTRYLARLPFFLAILLSFRLGVDYTVNRFAISENNKVIQIVIKFIVFLLITSIISITCNNESFALGLYDLRYYFLLVVLLLTIYRYNVLPFTEKGFVQFLVAIGLIQIPFTIIQYSAVTFASVRLGGSALDMSSGTFASYPSLVFFQMIAIGLVLVYQFRKRTPILKTNNYILIFFLTIPLLLSYSRSAMGFVIILSLIILTRLLFYSKSFSHFSLNLVALICIPIIIFLFFYHFFWQQHFDLRKQLNPRFVKEYFFRYAKPSLQTQMREKHGVMGRGRAVVESMRLISKFPLSVLFGLGSGSTSEAELLGLKGTYYQDYGPLAGLGRTQISKIIAELGFVGLAIFLTFFIALLRQARGVSRFDKTLLATDIYIVIFISILMISFYTRLLASCITSFVLAYYIAFIQSHLDKMGSNVSYEN